jgi:DNA-binding GntR family transcriptional regulator
MLPIDGLTRPGTTLANQLAAAIRRAIDKGDLLPEQAIPSEREICEEHSVSRSTVRRAISMLVEEGILYTVPGSGTYVRGGVPRTRRWLRLAW